MKASDITDEQFFSVLNEDGTPTMLWDLEERLGYPRKVVLAKARTLIRKRRGLDGCYCGCRGDFLRIQPDEAPSIIISWWRGAVHFDRGGESDPSRPI